MSLIDKQIASVSAPLYQSASLLPAPAFALELGDRRQPIHPPWAFVSLR